MSNRWVLFALFAAVACKGREDAAAEPARTAGADSAAALASSFAQAAAALAQAQAAASVAGVASAAPVVAAPAASATPAVASATPAVAEGFSAALSNELGRLGFSTTAAELVSLGKERGLLLSGLQRLAGHPAALSAIFSNDKVVSAFMKRTDMQEVCRDAEQLKHKLLFVLSSPAARAWVNDPASIKAFSGSKLGQQLQACPAFKTLVQQPKALASLTKDTPSALGVVNHANFRAELERLKIRQDAPPLRVSRKLKQR